MPKTIGKDKGSATRARAATTRSRAASAAEAEPVGDPSNDEPRDGDIAVAGDDELAPTSAAEYDAADVVDEIDDTRNGADETDETDETADEDELTGRELSVAEEGSLARRRSAAIARTPGVPEPLMANPITRFLAESYLELRKVTWPTMNEAWNMTLVVIVMSAVVAVILGLADAGLIKGLGWFLTTTHAGAPAATPTPKP